MELRTVTRTAGALPLTYSMPISNVEYTTSQGTKKAIDKRNGNVSLEFLRLRQETTPQNTGKVKEKNWLIKFTL